MHRRRWNIPSNPSEAYSQFRVRLKFLRALREWQEEQDSSTYTAINERYNFLACEYLAQEMPISVALANSGSFTEFVDRLQLACFVLEEYSAYNLIEEIYLDVQRAIEFTPQIELEIVKVGNRITLYPAGAKLLDDKVVNQTLGWLEPHPNVLKLYEKALVSYSKGGKSDYRNLLDDLRLAVEQLLNNILATDKNLENQEKLLLPWLQARGAHQQIINMFRALLFGPYKLYQNNEVKHQNSEVKNDEQERYAKADVEFMIYLTGTFMRLLLQLEQKA